MTQSRRPLLAILGPTASGKTALAIELAKRFDGEIISADSRQIYVGMDIGTDKIGIREQRTGGRNDSIRVEDIPHYLIDIRTPDQTYSVAEFREDALSVIKLVHEHGKLPIVAGGTGHYIRSLTEQVAFPDVPPDPAFRTWADAQSLDVLLKELGTSDPKTATRIDQKNRRRVVRALEVVRANSTQSVANSNSTSSPTSYALRTTDFRTLKLALTPPSNLRERIVERVDQQLATGLVEEVRTLVAKYGESAPGLQAIGYREVFPYLHKKATHKEMRDAIVRANWRYARRQMTWLRKEPNLTWVSSPEEALRNVSDWYGEK